MNAETFEAIGTKWRIELPDMPPKKRDALFEGIRRRIDVFDHTYSRFKHDSFISDIARTSGAYELPADARPLFDLYRKLYELTNGKFTPLIGQVLSDAGYDAHYSLKPKTLLKPPAWEDALVYEFPKLTVLEPVLLDFGAGGKGYLVDLISEMIERVFENDSKSILSYSVNAGGDIRLKSSISQGERIGLEHPDHSEQVIGIATISEGSICGSAGNRRTWGEFHHTIDPDTLASPQHIKAIWVTAKSALLADSLSTCLYFVSPDSLRSSYTFEYLIVYKDLTFESSPNFPAKLFT